MRALPTLTAIISLVLLPIPPLGNLPSVRALTLANSTFSSGSSDANRSAIVSSGMDEVLIASAMDEVPTVAFCEMVKHPRLYFDKTVRVTATLQLGIEASWFHDDQCALRPVDQIGVEYVSNNDQERDQLNSEIRKIQTIEYGGRAKVTVVGVLRNSSMRAFATYRYRFDVSRVENKSHVIVPYEGTLQGGITYRATVRGDSDSGLSLIVPLRRMNEQFAVRIEWTNLSEFPALAGLSSSSPEQQIVFTVVADQTKQMTAQRWNRTVECKIISVN